MCIEKNMETPANDYCYGYAEPPVNGMIDAHAHHNCGATCPLPLLYAQIRKSSADLIGPSKWNRQFVELLVGLKYSTGVDIQGLSTIEIGRFLVELNTRMNDENNSKLSIERYKQILNIEKLEKQKEKLKRKENLTKKEQKELLELEEQLKKEKSMLNETMTSANKKNIPSLIIVPTMDMEFAHLDGYEGIPIYQQYENAVFYNKRVSVSYPELPTDQKKKNISHEIKKKELDEDSRLKFQKWDSQISDTVTAAASDPLRLFPLFFYDPRRYRLASNKTNDYDLWPWDEPFTRIVSENSPNIWIGFKMYPSLGYSPLDGYCKYLPDFYKKCEDKKIPILTHCSPGGMISHEAHFYKKYRNVRRFTDTTYTGKDKLDENDEMDYFYKTYGHPENWRPVLEKFPKLHLCLAHFGGSEWEHNDIQAWCSKITSEYPPREWIESIIKLTAQYENVYTDLSCMNINDDNVTRALGKMLRLIHKDPKYGHLKNKLIFGTDWYLTYLSSASKNAEYSKYCNKFKELFNIDDTYWERFSLINPWNCYSLSIEKFKNMFDALKRLAEPRDIDFVSDAAKSTLEKLCQLNTYISQKKKELK